MPYHLEYTFEQTADERATVQGKTLAEAEAAATEVLRESGCNRALLRWTEGPSTVFGDGEIVATYTDDGGWEDLQPPSS